ncbi:hypothetical protein QRQ56_31105 [Bradyrhizobium sp. U531]|uniref:hypothetical protein n=1 Tax=Bradyrhizobium sp. U531 TaxID=3053458 RepID=UPI003F42AFAE
MAKKKSIVDRISSSVGEIVDHATSAAMEALKPDPAQIAGETNEQVYISDAAAVSPRIIPMKRKKRSPSPLRANKRVAAAMAKGRPADPKKAIKKTSTKATKGTSKSAAKPPSRKVAKKATVTSKRVGKRAQKKAVKKRKR